MASRHGIVSAEAGQDLRAVRRAVAAAPAELERLIHATASEQLSNAWIEELNARPMSKAQRTFILADARAIPLDSGLRVETGWDEMARIYEFGTNDRDKFTTYKRRHPKSGKRYSITRRTRRQLPERKAGGYVAYPAANRLGSRVFSMWAQLIRKVTHDWMEGK